jgi:hypothetical protein
MEKITIGGIEYTLIEQTPEHRGRVGSSCDGCAGSADNNGGQYGNELCSALGEGCVLIPRPSKIWVKSDES